MSPSTNFKDTKSPKKAKLYQTERASESSLELALLRKRSFGTMMSDLKNPETSIVRTKTILTAPSGMVWMVANVAKNNKA